MRVMKPIHVLGGLSAAAIFFSTAFLGAQAPPAPQRGAAPGGQAPPPAAPAAGRGGAPGSESGWATFEGQCFRCHGNTATNAKTTAWAIRQMTPERIYQALTSGKHEEGQKLSDIQKQRVGEFMAGRPMGLLDGVPATVKDLLNLAGFPTRRGSKTTDATPATEDAPAVMGP